jgi:hypothetical protein
MSLKLVPPSTAETSRTKACALVAFRLIRSAQSKAAQAPGALLEARNDVVAAWRESGAIPTKNA